MENGQLATLILEIAAADQAALGRLYDATRAELFGMLSGAFASSDEADEALLDVYTDVWRHAASFVPGSQPVRVWLRSLASLRALESLRPDMAAEGRNLMPPEYLKDLLMARIEREPRSTALHSRPATGEDAARHGGATPEQVGPGTVRRSGPWLLAGAALLAALVFLYEWRAAEQGRLQQAEELASAREETDQARARLSAEGPRAADMDKINAILGSVGSRVLALDGLPPGQAPGVAILWDVRAGQWLVTGYLQAPPAGRAYRLWLLAPGERRALATLDTDATGRVFTVLRVPDSIPKPATLQVTLDPAGGSAEPSSPVRALGRIM